MTVRYHWQQLPADFSLSYFKSTEASDSWEAIMDLVLFIRCKNSCFATYSNAKSTFSDDFADVSKNNDMFYFLIHAYAYCLLTYLLNTTCITFLPGPGECQSALASHLLGRAPVPQLTITPASQTTTFQLYCTPKKVQNCCGNSF